MEEYIESKLTDLSSYLRPRRPVRIYIEDDIIDKAHTITIDEFEKYFNNLPEETKKRIRSINKAPNYFVRIIFNEKELEALYGKERVREQDTKKSTEDNNR